MKKVLITGITGFLGPYLAREMLANQYEVYGISRHQPLDPIHGVTYWQGSITDVDFVMSCVQQVDLVIHSAAKSTTWGKYEDFYEVNVLGTKHIIQACQSFQIERLIYVSSPSVYAKFEHQFALSEEASQGPALNHYIATKREAENLVLCSNLTFNIIRPRAIVGVGDTSIVPRLFQAEKKIGIPYFHNGTNQISVTCVENVAYAVRLMCQTKHVGHVFNITDGVDWQFKELLDSFYNGRIYKIVKMNALLRPLSLVSEWLALLFHREPLLTRYVYTTLAYSQTLSIEKAINLLGYAPKKTLKDRLEDYRAYYFKD